MSKQAYEFCFCYRRMFKMRMAEPPEDVVNLFNKYSDNGAMSVERLHKFLVDFQGEDKATLEHTQAIFNSLKHHHVFHRRGLNLDAFFRYLFGDLNPPLAPLGVHHDMKAPLAHYFLYTGHNSYLTGNQLSSASSIEPIIKALRSGVRVIELDLWPNSKRNDVEVYHGGTMTSPVELIKCLEAIKENAFCASDYPVIITFEDHLDSFLQAKVAQMVNTTFGNILFPGMDFIEFPSPESLKRKILISTKPPKESGDSGKEEEINEQKVKNITDISVLALGDKGESINKSNYDSESQHNRMEEEEEEEEEAVIPEYKKLISIHAVKRKGSLENLLKGDSKIVARLSLKEQKLENAVRARATDIIRFTQKNLLRVYPKGTRILSSNYDPFIGWTHGAQMVAFNMQGYGKYLWMMQGMFRANGGCGYVKKPDFLLNIGPNNEVFDPTIRGKVKKTLKVKLYMGDGWHLEFPHTHFNQYSPPDFFTKLQLLGVPDDKKKVKTVPIEDQWVPLWNEEFEFPLTAPELALLRIEVRDYNMSRRHDFGGQTCLPVSELQSGIRAIPLYNKKGETYKRWLKFTKSEKTPQDVKDLFEKYKDTVRDRMSIDELQNFLIKEKEMTKEDAITSALKIIDSRKLKGFSNLWRNSLSLSGFLHYLLSKHNLPLAKKELDEKAAFVHYFVYTSHSSYLKQNEEEKKYYNITEQGLDIASSNKKKVHSSIKAIEKALQSGVKVIELDLWLSSDKTKIYVDREGGLQSHSPVTLDKCLKTIKKNAFTTSEFPLILILVEHFGSDLTADETSNLRDNIKKEFSQFECLPKIDQLANRSLESLKKKIIILKRQTEQEQSSANVNEESEYISGYIEVLEDEEIQNSLKAESNKLRICSLTEKQLENRETTPNSEVTSFTQKNLLAVHPNSNLDDPVIKNYDPLIGWMHGAQMVALYMQDKCKYLWIMQGLFRAQEVDKNPTGYVKKPEILLKESPIFDPTAWRPVKKILKVKVYLGTGWHLDFGNENFDMDTPPDFFAAVEIVGVPADEAREKTVPAMDQWIPSWDQEFTFPLTVPELAMLVIEVKEFDTDRTHDFGGQTCLPVCQLERGIRSVPLYDRKGVAYRSAKLLMCFEY